MFLEQTSAFLASFNFHLIRKLMLKYFIATIIKVVVAKGWYTKLLYNFFSLSYIIWLMLLVTLYENTKHGHKRCIYHGDIVAIVT